MLRLLLILSPIVTFAQGPLDGYLKGKGVLDLAPSFSFNSASTFSGSGGAAYDEPFKGQMLSVFAEYGLTERFDLVANASAVFTQNQSGLQDGGIFAKYRPFRAELGKTGTLNVLFGTGATFPIGSYEPTAAGALGQRAVTVPARLILQWETPLGLFFNATAGYHFRIDDLKEADIERVRQQRPSYAPGAPPNFTTFLIKTGFPARHFYLDAWVEWQRTKGGADYVQNLPDLPQAYGVDFTQAGGTAYYSDNGRTGFFLSGGFMWQGRNTSLMRRVTFGMVFKFEPKNSGN
jgi:hypothetical protein